MPMDTLRVPSDEFELVFLKQVETNGNQSFYLPSQYCQLLSQDSTSDCSINQIWSIGWQGEGWT